MQPRTLWAVLDQTASQYPDQPALQQPLGGGKYRTWSYGAYRDAVREVALGLRALGVAKGEIVGLQSETRAEFYLADMGTMTAGAIAAAVYTSMPPADQAKALHACSARTIFSENEKSMRALLAAGAPVDARWILLTGSADGCLTLDQVRETGRKAGQSAFERLTQEFDDSAHAVLYMTSGATGEPKMGLVTHRAIVSNIDMGPAVLPLSPSDCTIAFLPSAHIAQRMVSEFLPMRDGVCVWFSESLAKLPAEMRTVRPTFFLAPPRVWERMFSSISTEIKKKPRAIQKMFHAAVGLGSEAARLRQQGKAVPVWIKASLAVFDRVLFAKIRERLGGRLRFAVSGAAPLGRDLAEFYTAVGLPLVEGYGLTEGGVTTLNPLDRPKSGSIGKMLPGVEAKLDEDGELLLSGPTLFSGYYNDPAATAAIFRGKWLATGDIAAVDGEGYYYITGRKKEIIVSSNGKKIYPARLEGMLKREPMISQVLLAGDKMPYITALITVNGPPAEAQAAVERAVKDANRELADFERVRKFKVLDREFSIELGEVTPTMKIRRSRVLENHRALIAEMYLGREVE